jgi:hypothetical protein
MQKPFDEDYRGKGAGEQDQNQDWPAEGQKLRQL